jgi:hypothetical protein
MRCSSNRLGLAGQLIKLLPLSLYLLCDLCIEVRELAEIGLKMHKSGGIISLTGCIFISLIASVPVCSFCSHCAPRSSRSNFESITDLKIFKSLSHQQ